MKKLYFLIIIMLITSTVIFAQTPSGINYQGIARDNSGSVLANKTVSLRFSVLSGSVNGTTVYAETHVTTTDGFGLFLLMIGQGTIVAGTWNNINWGSNAYCLKVEIDPAGGTNFQLLGTNQFAAVPYALYAEKSGAWNSATPSIVTQSISDLSYTSANVNVNITNNGNEYIIVRGVCLSRNSSPDLNDTVYLSSSTSLGFSTLCNQLLPNKTYYVRAFASNTIGTAYGSELSFTTKSLTTPTIITQSISNISNTSAVVGGNITDDGGSSVLSRGLYWSNSVNPTTANSSVTEGQGSGSFNAMMSGLTANTLYHVRPFAINAQGTAYGHDTTLTTIVLPLASVTTTAVSSIGCTTATGGGNVTSDNGSSVSSRGVCWATTTMPTTANSNVTQSGGLGTFTVSLTGLTVNKTYYVRSFAINGGGTSYGSQVSFTTTAPALASVTTTAISGISSYLAASGGTINSDGCSSITAKGVCWSINHNPTIANSKTTDGTGTATFNSSISGLNPLTLYYVRAYATNSTGTAYGNEVSFTTTDLISSGPSVPVVGTSTSAITGGSTASSGGYVSNDGGSSVTVRGVCWSTSQNPTLANSFSTDGGQGTGYFSSTINGLSGCGVVYYVRAYATNSTGTGYGNQNSVSTGLLPTITTNDASSISYYSATSGGTITDNGGCAISQKGICWNYATGPTISNWHTSDGTGSGSFVSTMTGLLGNRTYYVRSYATNSVGTAYGPEKVFTTLTPATPYIGQNYAGGIVFYIDGTGLHGLVCAATDQGQYSWGCYPSTSILTSTALGTGATNTAAIVAGCSDPNTAAKICDNLVLNGYSDWFLPSKDEFDLIYSNIYLQGISSFSFSIFNYWCSSEQQKPYAWCKQFMQPFNWTNDNKNSNNYVRAVRAF